MDVVVDAFSNVSSSLYNTSVDIGHTVVESTGTQIDMTWVVSGGAVRACIAATIISCIISGIDMWHHTGSFNHPKLQSGTVRILFMIPVYSVLSVATLIVPETRFLFRTVRDTYEAFVLYQFLALLVEYCGGEAQLVQSLERKRYKGVHPFPMCFLPMFPLDRAFFMRCKRWVLQYAVIKPLMAVVALATHPFGIFEETNLNFKTNVFAWVFLVNNLSISWSLWYLVVFHQETEKELHYCKPLLKFICIKSIIFFSYWQTSALGVMLSVGMIYTGETPEEQEHVGGCIQEFLICLELVPIAVLHHFGFGVEKLKEEMKEHPLYESASAVRRGTSRFQRLDEALSLGQFFRDTVDAVFVKANQLRHGGSKADGDEAGEDGPAGGAHRSRQKHTLFSRVAWPQSASLPDAAGSPIAMVPVADYSESDGEDEASQHRQQQQQAGGPKASDTVAVTVDPSAEVNPAQMRPPLEPTTTLTAGAVAAAASRSRDLLEVCYDTTPTDASATSATLNAAAVDQHGGGPLHTPPPAPTATEKDLRTPPPGTPPPAATPPPASTTRNSSFGANANTVPLEKRRAPIPLHTPGAGKVGGASSSTAVALELCAAVAAAHGETTTTADVMHAAVLVELERRRANGDKNLPTGPAALARLQALGQDMYDWSSDGEGDETPSDEDDAARDERESREAFSFGLQADDFRIVTQTATQIRGAVQWVLFDEAPTVSKRFCVVCGRSDREMVQRKSGLKCRECLGIKHNYKVGAEDDNAGAAAAAGGR